jgi:hypothetical protein
MPAKATLMGFLHLPVPEHSELSSARAIEFTLHRVAHCCRLSFVFFASYIFLIIFSGSAFGA